MATNSTGDITKTNKSEMEQKRRIRVLIVSEKEANRYEKLVEEELGGDSQVVTKGEDALDIMKKKKKKKREEHEFDLVIIDKDLSLRDGAWTAKMLRDVGVTSKIIGVSPDPELTVNFAKAGLDCCFPSPLDTFEFKATVEAWTATLN